MIKSLNTSYQRQTEDLRFELDKIESDQKQSEKNIRVRAKKKAELEEITFKKALLFDQRVLNVLESKLSENTLRRETELRLIQANQQASAQSYLHEHDIKKQELQTQYDKSIQQIDLSIQNAIKNHASLDESVTNKNQAILGKYEINHEKSMTMFKQKSDHLTDIIDKGKRSQEERLRDEMNLIKRMNVKREKELKNIQTHYLRFNRDTKNDQNDVYNKELRLLKRTHRSKVKMLHLN